MTFDEWCAWFDEYQAANEAHGLAAPWDMLELAVETMSDDVRQQFVERVRLEVVDYFGSWETFVNGPDH